MIRPMFGHRAKPKKFDLPLRYHDPKKDLKRRQRIKFKSNSSRKRSQTIRIIVMALGLAFVIWVITTL